MYILRPDEKTTPVMLYTQEAVIRGEVVTKQIVNRINIWLRTDGVPKYMHLINAQVVVLGGGPGKALSYPELYFPTGELIGFHTLPPSDEPLDFAAGEANRMMAPVEALVGTLVMKGQIRISTQTEIGVSLEVARVSWMSLYDALITIPHLPQMPPLSVRLVLINPLRTAFAITESAKNHGNHTHHPCPAVPGHLAFAAGLHQPIFDHCHHHPQPIRPLPLGPA